MLGKEMPSQLTVDRYTGVLSICMNTLCRGKMKSSSFGSESIFGPASIINFQARIVLKKLQFHHKIFNARKAKGLHFHFSWS